MITQKLTYGKDAANLKNLFAQQPLIISTFIEKVLTTEFVEQFIKSRFGLASEKYNIRLFHSLRGYLCGNWKPSFLPRLIFNRRTFSRLVTACW